MPGKYELTPVDRRVLDGGMISLTAGKETRVTARIMNEEYFGELLKRGDADLVFVFRRLDGSVFMSEQLPFDADSVKKYYVRADATER